jgi:phosphoglycerate dehydrogenase-like enzyme
MIASRLEPHEVERIRAVSPQLDVIYEPELLAPVRWSPEFRRTPENEVRWRELLARAEIMFDFDYSNREVFPELAPNVRWVQTSFAGIGQLVNHYRYVERMPQARFTTASGVHAKPLAELCILGMLSFSRGLFRLQHDQRERRWQRRTATDLDGRTLGIVGVGNIGAEVARLARAFGMQVLGIKRDIAGIDPESLHVHELYSPDGLYDVLRRSEFLVLVTPHTSETEHLIGERELALLPQGAVLINIGRGAVVDEQAMIAALQSGRLAGAVLDVFEKEPLPPESPLWDMPNVLISPHAGGMSDREGTRLTDLFCENLRRFLAGEPLINLYNPERAY